MPKNVNGSGRSDNDSPIDNSREDEKRLDKDAEAKNKPVIDSLKRMAKLSKEINKFMRKKVDNDPPVEE